MDCGVIFKDTGCIPFLKTAESIGDLRGKVAILLMELGGLTDFSFVLDLNTADDNVLITNPKEQLEIYFCEKFQDYDFMIDYTRLDGNQPIYQSQIYKVAYEAVYNTTKFERNRAIIDLNRKYGYYDYFCMQHPSILVKDGMPRQILFAVTQRYLDTHELRKIITPIERELINLCKDIDFVIATKFPEFIAIGNGKIECMVLNDIEKQFLKLLSQGKKPKEVAYYFNMETNAIYQYLYRIRRKLGVRKTQEAVREALRVGYI